MAKGSLSSATRTVLDIRKFRPKIDPRLARAIGRCLETDPAARYHSLEEFVRDLGPLPGVDAA